MKNEVTGKNRAGPDTFILVSGTEVIHAYTLVWRLSYRRERQSQANA